MKNCLLLIILLFPSFYTFSQEFAPVGAKWHYTYDKSYLTYESVGDTIIQGKKCNIVESESDSTVFFYEKVRIFLHTSGDKVEAFIYNDFYTLFDFGAQPGDSWMVPNFESFEYPPCDSLGKVVVDSISNEIINSTNLKVLYVKFDNSYLNPVWFWQGNYDGPIYGKLIEVIGSESMLFPRASCVTEIPFPAPLRCYSDSVFGFYETGIVDSCDYIDTSSTNLKNKFHERDFVEFFPNPTSHSSTLRFQNPQKEKFRLLIFNNLGQIMLEKIIFDDKVNLTFENFKQGFYLLHLISPVGNHYSKKIIIH